MTPAPFLATDPLTLVALETEREVNRIGWDQNPRLFALVRTDDLIVREPQLAETMNIGIHGPDALSAVEQEDVAKSSSLETLLGKVMWPDTVDGAAIAIERVVVPPEAEHDLPEDPTAAIDALSKHPGRQDVRLLVAVHRDGRHICLLRQRSHDSDDQVARGENIAPGVVQALLSTFDPV